MSRRRVLLLGSTGSIGTQTLDVIARNADRFEVVGLTAGTDAAGLAAQAERFGVAATALGADAAEALVREVAADVVVNGITGAAGLGPTLAALETGTTLALANKESLIIGGPLVTRAARPGQIVPVDSEHSAIAQCLASGTHAEVRRLVLTASGGPFRGMSAERLAEVTPQEALRHPTWDMGLMVTTNSATLVNKGLEVIEAHLLFDVPLDAIDVVVHPQSIVHSMVEFTDGATIAQASPPDMRLPISLGLDWPHRVPGVGVPLDFTQRAGVGVRAARRGRVPRRADREAGRGSRRHGARALQRGERGGGARVPRGADPLPGHHRHDPGRARRGARRDRRPRPGRRARGRSGRAGRALIGSSQSNS